jgi:hypothetical protein
MTTRMTDDLSPIDAVIHGWELTRDWLRQDMEEVRHIRNTLMGAIDVAGDPWEYGPLVGLRRRTVLWQHTTVRPDEMYRM